MPKLLRIFSTGLLISFLGTLPLGTLNIAAMQISIADGFKQALLFSLGSLTSEMIYVRLSLVAMDWVRKQEKLFRILEWVTLGIVVALAVATFYAALHPSAEHKNVILSSNLNKYLLGLSMSAVSPMQIPFWFGWSTVLFTKKILLPRKDFYNAYTVGIGLGTLLGNAVFIFGGQLIASKISSHQNVVNWVIGAIFTITALIQIYKIFKKKDPLHDLEHPEEVEHRVEHQADLLRVKAASED